MDWSKSRHWYFIKCVSMHLIHFGMCQIVSLSLALSLRRKAWAERVLTEWVNDLILSVHIIIENFCQTTKNRLIGSGTITNMTLIWSTIHRHRSDALATLLNTINNICATFNSQNLIIWFLKFYTFIVEISCKVVLIDSMLLFTVKFCLKLIILSIN